MSRGGLVRRGGPLGAEGANSDDIAFMESLNAMMGDGDVLADLASRGFTLPELQHLGAPIAPPVVPDSVRQKRREKHLIADWSDPAGFSSDNMPDSAENYEQPRSDKRQRRSDWWAADFRTEFEEHEIRYNGPPGTMSADPRLWEREIVKDLARIARMKESGFSSQIYPDCSHFLSKFDWPTVPDPEEATVLETSEVLPSSRDDLRVFQERLDNFEKAHVSHWYRVEDGGASGSTKLVRISNADEWDKVFGKLHAAEKVEYCVEYGLEVVHLGSSLLGSVSSASLRPLRYLTTVGGHRNQFVKDSRLDVPEEPRDNRLTPYVSLVPLINLFLEKNRLQFLPGALYSIRNVSVLSVRDNQLISLLPSISHVPFPCELDLSNNCLLWLPYELKKFAIIPDQLKTAGNPLVLANIDHPRCRLLDHEIKVDVTRAIFHHRMWLRRTTAVIPLDGSGSAGGATGRMSMFHASIGSSRPVVDPEWLKAYVPSEEPLPDLEQSTKVPSLMETVLRAASKQPSLYMFVANMPEDLPPTLAMLLRHTLRVKEAEGQMCSVCQRMYIVPRTEWIEWWSFGMDDDNQSWIPFIRYGCSSSCFVNHEARKARMGRVEEEWFI